MYDFVTHTWNPVKGRCVHGCPYCYVKRIAHRFGQEQQPVHLDEKEMHTDFGCRNVVFVGSSRDLFAADVPGEWIERILLKCCTARSGNRFLFQSKNPARFLDSRYQFPDETTFCTTLESNRAVGGNAPPLAERVAAMNELARQGHKTMVTVEPVHDFDLVPFLSMLFLANPGQVNIGADTGRNHLPEPSPEKVRELIGEAGKFTTVHLKRNLQRLLGDAGEAV
jgi:hypothetical protein